MIRKLVLAAIVAAAPCLTPAQAPSQATEAASEQPAQLNLQKTVMFGTIKTSTSFLLAGAVQCASSSESAEQLPANLRVLLVQKRICNGRYSGYATYYEILYEGKRLLVPEDSLRIRDSELAELDAVTDEEREASMSRWELFSLDMAIRQGADALKEVRATSKHGIAISMSRIFDTSEHTEGTGFEIEFFNTTKKTIKYVTFYAVGFNAVDDPVRDRITGSTTVSFRGIGPIEPKGAGSYTRKYLWTTDLVESFKLTSVKLEFTDGTSKVVKAIDAVQLSAATVAALNSPNLSRD